MLAPVVLFLNENRRVPPTDYILNIRKGNKVYAEKEINRQKERGK